MAEWVCLKCGYKWIEESKIEPRFCPVCGTQMIYTPKIVKPPKR